MLFQGWRQLLNVCVAWRGVGGGEGSMIHSINLIAFLHGSELQSGDSSPDTCPFHFAYRIEISYSLQKEVVHLALDQ